MELASWIPRQIRSPGMLDCCWNNETKLQWLGLDTTRVSDLCVFALFLRDRVLSFLLGGLLSCSFWVELTLPMNSSICAWVLGFLEVCFDMLMISNWRRSDFRGYTVCQANAAYSLHCYVHRPWCFGQDRSLSKVAQQSSFQSLVTFLFLRLGYEAKNLQIKRRKGFLKKKSENAEKDVNEREKKNQR